MHDFKFKNNELFCESVRVRDIARQVGTPCYIYSTHTLTDHFTKIQKAFAKINPLICFAMKSNSNLAVLKVLKDLGAGFDIVSGGELRKALKIKVDPKKIVFASVGKTQEEIRLAIKSGILLLNVESTAELQAINRLARQLNRKVEVAIRVNPDVDAATHKAITTGTLKNKFGIDLAATRSILRSREQYSHLRFTGLHIHIGSQIVSADPFLRAIRKIVPFIHEMKREGVPVKYFDIGGGLGIIYKDEKPQTAKKFAQAILPLLEQSGVKIIMEPGRFIAGNAGILITKVLYLKDNGSKKFLIVDAGMNDLMRPALYNAYHEIVPVRKKGGRRLTVDIVGPICESSDVFGKDRRLPPCKTGDLLAIMGAGAYGYVMASNYNVRPRPPEVIVKGKRFAIARKRETFSDLIRGESIPKIVS